MPEELTVEIIKPIYGGSGLGFVNGKAVIIPLALPGDTIRAVSVSETGDYLQGAIKELLVPSPIRIEPPCPNFGACGGCSYLNVDYPAELEIKLGVTEDTLRRIAGLRGDDRPAITVISGERFRYRSHGDFKYRQGKAGFYMAATNRIVPMPDTGCLLFPDGINRAAAENICTDGSCKIAMDNTGTVHYRKGDTTIREKENGILYDRGIDNFFQINRHLRGEMQRKVLSMSRLPHMNDRPGGETFVDVGCGIGFFTLYLARHSMKGIGIEVNAVSVTWAEKNARLNGVDNVSFHAMDAGKMNPVTHRGDIVILDPPRAGLSKHARRTVIDMEPRVIVYASCDPPTFSRDIRTFLDAGFSLDELTLIDMFPGTHHIEVLGRLTVKAASISN